VPLEARLGSDQLLSTADDRGIVPPLHGSGAGARG
jgi:hypothetical protein